MSSPLAAPNLRSQCCRETESVPPSLAHPESRPATTFTMSSVMSTGVRSGGQSGYESQFSAVGVRASGCLERNTSITWSPVFMHHSLGWMTLPISLSVIQLTAVWSFLWSTRLWNVCARISSISSLLATVRYYVHLRRVFFTSMSCFSSVQLSRRFSILRWIEWDAVTCRARFRITV